MRRARLSFVFWVALACPGWAQEPMVPPAPPGVVPSAPTIAGPDAVPVCRLVRLHAVGEVDSVAWLVLPAGADGEPTADGGYVFAGPPGTYTVVLMAVSGGKPSLATRTITVGEPVSPPTPPEGGNGNGAGPKPPAALVTLAKGYFRGTPAVLRSVARQTREGTFTSLDHIWQAIDGGRKQVGEPMVRGLSERLAPLLDDQGKIKDPEALARVLEQLADAMEVVVGR
jgi:hypothetical protein